MMHWLFGRHGLLYAMALLAAACGADSAPQAPRNDSRPIPPDAQAPVDAGAGKDGAASVVPGPEPSTDARAESFEHLQIEAGGFVFDALAAGPEDGELVLLLHGFPQTSYEWRAQLEALADAGYRAVAPDQRGYSPGARPPDVEAYNILELMGDAVGIVDALGYDAFHVVGHDWGGGVAWGLAALVPDRLLTLTAVSTPHPAALAAALEDPDSCQFMASGYFQILSQPDSSAEDLAAIGVGLDGISEDAVREYLQRVISQPDVLDLALNWYRANVPGGQLTAAVGAIEVPTLYLWGTADPAFCQETAEDSAQYVESHYRFVAIEGGGHWLPETETSTVNRELLAHLAQ